MYIILPLLAIIFSTFSSCAVKPAKDDKSRGPFEMVSLHTRYKMKLSNDCSAGAALVLKDGHLIYEEYFGRLDRKPQAPPVTASSRFPLYSISKEFGIAVLFSLVSEGLVGLDDPVVKYFDYFTGPGPGGTGYLREKVTVRQLASHTSGVTGEKEDLGEKEREFSKVTLEFEAGTCFHYNEVGMKILGRIMEKVGGKPYEDLLRERILEPLGLKSVGYLRQEDDLTDIVYSCDGLDSSFVGYSPNPYPGSGLFATMRDIARFGQFWLDKGKVGDKALFSSELLQEAWINYNHCDKFTPDREYGLMFWLCSEEKAVIMAGAAQTVAAILPEQNMVVVVGLNQVEGSPGWGRPQIEHSNVARLGLALDKVLEKSR